MTTREAKRTVRLQEWGQMVKACQESGLKVEDWCSQNSITVPCYYYRLAQVRKAVLDRSSQSPALPTLVKVNTAATPLDTEQNDGTCFRLRFNHATLEIPVGTKSVDIAEVLKAVGQYAF